MSGQLVAAWPALGLGLMSSVSVCRATLSPSGDPGKTHTVDLVPTLRATVGGYAGCSLRREPQSNFAASVQAVVPGAELHHLQEGD